MSGFGLFDGIHGKGADGVDAKGVVYCAAFPGLITHDFCSFEL
jgi:hypothetical protein